MMEMVPESTLTKIDCLFPKRPSMSVWIINPHLKRNMKTNTESYDYLVLNYLIRNDLTKRTLKQQYAKFKVRGNPHKLKKTG